VCLQLKLWGKAKDYLQQSIVLQPQSETYKLMAQYFDAVGEPDNALLSYQQAEMQHSQMVLIGNSNSGNS
jgi:HemY protein